MYDSSVGENNSKYLKMSEITESMLFKQKLYENFKESGLLSKLKTSLRANLLQKLEKPVPTHESAK